MCLVVVYSLLRAPNADFLHSVQSSYLSSQDLHSWTRRVVLKVKVARVKLQMLRLVACRSDIVVDARGLDVMVVRRRAPDLQEKLDWKASFDDLVAYERTCFLLYP